MADAVAAHGTVLLWNWHKILELTNITGPSESRETIDITSHDSTDRYKEFVAGVASGGEVSLEGNFIKGDINGQIKFHADIQSGTKRTGYIVMPMAVGGSLLFEAHAKGFAPAFPYEDKIGVSGSLEVTGKPTLLTVQSAGITGLTGIEQNIGAALSITPAIAAGTYAYICTVNTASTWVKLTVTAAGHTIYVQGVTQTSGVQG
ncbi:MAG: phage tail tube protein, partial [Ignavibacteria bacterium]|nr:phage tail tube protein [Ignavibacteria bacterium]